MTTTSNRSTFAGSEIEYLRGQRLGRIATVGKDGQPHVVPVGFRYNAETRTIDVGGHGIARSKKWRDAQRDPKVAIVIDDLASVSPWRPRGIEVRGEAVTFKNGGQSIGPGFDPEVIRIVPSHIVSWGLDDEGGH